MGHKGLKAASLCGGEVEHLLCDLASLAAVFLHECLKGEWPRHIVGLPFDEAVEEVGGAEIEDTPVDHVVLAAWRLETHGGVAVKLIHQRAGGDCEQRHAGGGLLRSESECPSQQHRHQGHYPFKKIKHLKLLFEHAKL